MNQKLFISLIILSVLLLNSCGIFRSKYVDIETQDGTTNTDYKLKIAAEKSIVSGSSDKAVLNLILNAQNSEISDADWLGYTFLLTNEYDKAVHYELIFAHDSIISGLAIKEGLYNITLIDDNLQQLDIPAGSFKIVVGQEKEVHITLNKATTTVSNTIKTKVRRKDLKRQPN